MDPREKQIRDGLGAWSRGDLEGALQGLSPDVHYVTSGLFPGVSLTYSGHEGFRQFWNDFRTVWDRISIEIDRIEEGRPGHFAVLGRFDAMGRDGVPVGRPIGQVFVVQDGLVVEIRSTPTWEEALTVAGVATGRPADS